MKKLFSLVVFFFAVFSQSSFGDVPKFEKVVDGIFRSGRPDQAGISQIAQLGIRVDLDVENISSVIQQEQGWAQSAGLGFVSDPMSASTMPTDQQVDRILNMLVNGQKPILIHCHYGEDRTGLIIGLYRVFYQHWTPTQAYQEMIQLGFHPQLRGLDQYFRQKTGYNGP